MVRASKAVETLLLTEYRRLSAADRVLVQREAARLVHAAAPPLPPKLAQRLLSLRRHN